MKMQERQPYEYATREKSLETRHPLEEISMEVVQTLEKDAKAVELLLLKCKDDWIHHMAQALSFSLLTALAPIAIPVLAIVHLVLDHLDTGTQQKLTLHLEGIIPQPLSSPVRGSSAKLSMRFPTPPASRNFVLFSSPSCLAICSFP